MKPGSPAEDMGDVGDAAPHDEARPLWARVRSRLEAAGFRPSRRLGQNFLFDENMARAIVRDAELGPAATVLEVGPGPGLLTVHLAPLAQRLVCVEIDGRLLEIARELCAGFAHIEWLHTDVLASKHRLAPEVVAALPAEGPWQLVSNLPYSVSAPLLATLCDLPNPPARMTALVQLEVAERIVAAPASPDWGPLTIRLALDYRASLVRRVPPQLFWPRPEVESALVRLERLAEPCPPSERERLVPLVAHLFQHRRQALGRLLSQRAGRPRAEAVLADLGLAPRARAEDLDLATLRRLARELDP